FNTANGFGAVLHFDDKYQQGDRVDATANQFSVYDIDESSVENSEHGKLNGNYYFGISPRFGLDYQDALYGDKYTFSVWIRIMKNPKEWAENNQPRLWTREASPEDSTVFEAALENLGGDTDPVSLRYRSLNNTVHSNSGYVSSATDVWQYLTVTAGPDSVRFYVDGEKCGAEELATPWEYPRNENNPYIGNDSTGERPFRGYMDELRFSAGTVRSDSWIKLSYENQRSPSSIIRFNY
ncbi:MAG: LamG-like jellyroll fold domain-containing protein, partial [Chitinivibrionales bacterium]